MTGDTAMIQNLLRLADSVVKLPKLPVEPGAIQYTVALARAYLTLDRRDTARAIREFESLPDSLCHECGWSWLTRAQLLESQGRLAEAAAVLDHTTVLNSTMGTLTEFARARLAEKLETRPAPATATRSSRECGSMEIRFFSDTPPRRARDSSD